MATSGKAMERWTRVFDRTVVASVKGLYPRCTGRLHSHEQGSVTISKFVTAIYHFGHQHPEKVRPAVFYDVAPCSMVVTKPSGEPTASIISILPL